MPTRSRQRPKTLVDFEARFPGVFRRYAALRDACDQAGPLPARTRELVKIAIEVARKRHGGLVAHIERARRAGASDEEIAHAMLLALPLVGLPDVLDAFRTSGARLKSRRPPKAGRRQSARQQ